ncbi:unnamed protein product [Fusarium graminearum]|uniref:Uncharacterized protein n=1 Tax=Gibberella zeae TaxID=5518 RepID=A0A4U9EKQ4_GIBZA|nr:unnamed protein product [Fusarium graminearum]CAF3562381.1 unnamed protein product [Fusarium graminearum]CAF3610433.1 unnamed protein product [Fusarium graminearum]CAG1968822.1 unnamed protein product [Fusarium graminearum]CAG1973579.1 unnamed protein product [Fusarium graminearum]
MACKISLISILPSRGGAYEMRLSPEDYTTDGVEATPRLLPCERDVQLSNQILWAMRMQCQF